MPAEGLPLIGDVHLPLYRRLRDTLARQIADAVYRPGDALPAELDLARRYQIAPGTVRKAIDELVSEGLIERRHGSGTFVRRPNFDNMMVRFFLFRDTAGKLLRPKSRIVSRMIVPASTEVAANLGEPDGEDVIHIVRLRSWDEAPRLVEDIYLPLDRFRPMLEIDADEIGPLLYPAYEDFCGQLVCFIEEEISITDASDQDREILGLAQGDLVVVVERRARDASGRILEWRLSRGEAKRFHYRINIR